MSRKIISVESISKDFKLPHKKLNSIKGAFTNMLSIGRNTYETQHALKNISFEIEEGEFFGIVGRNGSGKSTLLKILAGIYQPTKGKVFIGGKVVPFIELGVGFNGELTGRENVYLNGALLGFSSHEIDQKLNEIIEFAELERFIDQKLKNYSSGMQVRLAFSVATKLAESDILLIDEVLAVGDASFQRKCLDYFRELKRLKKTVIFVSHDMGSVAEYCDRAILVENGVIKHSGSANKIADKYLQMFIDEKKEETKSNIEQKKWGSGEIQIKEVKINKNTISDEDNLELTVELQANEDVDNFTAGFSIKDDTDAELLGTNTKILKHKDGPIKKGESRIYIWTVENIFKEGKYNINTTVSDGRKVYEKWENAIGFEVVSKIFTPFVVRPKIKVQNKK